MTYSVKEIFTRCKAKDCAPDGPRFFVVSPAVIYGRDAKKTAQAQSANFADTDFVGTDGTLGGKFHDADALAEQIAALWPIGHAHRYVVLTGGEPLLQVDQALIAALHAKDFEIAVETNGTLEAPAGIDWICVSPKAGAPWVQREGHELKLVYPQPALMPDDLGPSRFEHYLLQAMDGPDRLANTRAAIAYCQSHPSWRLSVQTHKVLEIR